MSKDKVYNYEIDIQGLPDLIPKENDTLKNEDIEKIIVDATVDMKDNFKKIVEHVIEKTSVRDYGYIINSIIYNLPFNLLKGAKDCLGETVIGYDEYAKDVLNIVAKTTEDFKKLIDEGELDE